MRITRALITAASPAQKTLPLQRLVDRDGSPKTLLQIIVAEARQAGIEHIVVVVAPGSAESYVAALPGEAQFVQFIEQTKPRGYGHAVLIAREAMHDEPFLHLVGDHIYISNQNRGCAQQIIDIAESESCAVSAVQASREHVLPYVGVIGGRPVPGKPQHYTVDRVIEKPTPTAAEQHLLVPGLRVGHYLCLFGMHVLTPTIFSLLAAEEQRRPNDLLQLSPALDALARHERYLAVAELGKRYDTGAPYGLLAAQLALGLNGTDREEVLATIAELLLHRRID
ncbi:MAG: sugar phosphate nucleotidyltransferase [Roseiflexaceae bacterium]